jgi:hypothetical protein
MEEVYVLGRREPPQREIAQAPQIQALGEHRVQVAVQRLLDERAAVGLAKRQVLGPQVLGDRALGARDGDVHPPQWLSKRAPGQQVGHRRGGRADVGPFADPPGGQVHHHVLGRPAGPCQVGRDGTGQRRQVVQRRVRGDQVHAPAGLREAGRTQQVAVPFVERQVDEVLGPVVPAHVHLEQQLAEPVAAAVTPLPQQRATQRLR